MELGLLYELSWSFYFFSNKDTGDIAFGLCVFGMCVYTLWEEIFNHAIIYDLVNLTF